MVSELNHFINQQYFNVSPTGGNKASLESLIVANAQRNFIGILADYKEWKTSILLRADKDPSLPTDIKSININDPLVQLKYIFSDLSRVNERIKNVGLLLASKPESENEQNENEESGN